MNLTKPRYEYIIARDNRDKIVLVGPYPNPTIRNKKGKDMFGNAFGKVTSNTKEAWRIITRLQELYPNEGDMSKISFKALTITLDKPSQKEVDTNE